MDSKATMLHSMAQKGVEVVSVNKPMIIQEGKHCWLSASVTSVHVTSMDILFHVANTASGTAVRKLVK